MPLAKTLFDTIATWCDTTTLSDELPSHWLLGTADLTAWPRCPKKVQLAYLNGLRWPASQDQFTLGKSTHALMDAQANHLMTPDLWELWQASDKYQQAARLSQALAKHKVAKWPVVASEWAFNIALPQLEGAVPLLWPVRLVGRVDRVAQPKGGQVALIDWKTGTRIPQQPSQAWQTRLYAFALVASLDHFSTALPWPEHPISFTYLQGQADGKVVARTCTYTEETHAETHEALFTTALHMQWAHYSHWHAKRYGITRRRLAYYHRFHPDFLPYRLPKTCPDAFCGLQHQCGILAPPKAQPPQEATPPEGLACSQLQAKLPLDEATQGLF